MKKRLQNKVTSIIGIIIILIALAMIFATYFIEKYEFTILQYSTVLFLGWIFMAAKNSIIEGITMGIWKPKNKQ
jgi:hypothetical protein